MALKNDRYEAITDISYFMDQVAVRGGIACMKTAGSGVALDQSEAEVEYAAAPSGKLPVGLLLNDVVNKDLTQTHMNFHKNEMQKGGKVTLLMEGWVVTDMITPGITPLKGQKAYVYESGYISNTAVSDASGMATPAIGRFLSTKDEDGYCKVYVKMPAS
jgi:hypothetical protein